MVIIGVLLIIAAIVLIVVHVLSRKKIVALLVSKPQTTKELKESAAALASEIGDGAFREMASVRGQACCKDPLISPIGNRPCLYYEATVVHEYEEPYERRDQNGRIHHETRRGSETMSSQHQGCSFYLDDGQGNIEVHNENAEYDSLVESVNRFEPGHGQGSQANGNFLMQLGLSLISPRGGRRTLGYRYNERILPITTLTAIGEVSNASGNLQIRKGSEHKFIISQRTREEILGSAQSTAKGTSIGSGVCALLGIILTIIGVVAG